MCISRGARGVVGTGVCSITTCSWTCRSSEERGGGGGCTVHSHAVSTAPYEGGLPIEACPYLPPDMQRAPRRLLTCHRCWSGPSSSPLRSPPPLRATPPPCSRYCSAPRRAAPPPSASPSAIPSPSLQSCAAPDAGRSSPSGLVARRDLPSENTARGLN